ncbi:MAG: 6-phosphogluconolactonase [Gammaproteobacteria bacterium]
MNPNSKAGPRWCCLPDADTVCSRAVAMILDAAASAIDARGCFRIVLAGGRTPFEVYRQLASSAADWAAWQVYFGDERCLPAGHAERNSVMAAAAWLDLVPIAPENVHPIPAEQGAAAAARLYTAKIADVRPFDLVLLGMGADGHTASLFPGHAYPLQEAVHAVHNAPKAPAERVSLSRMVLSDARDVLVLVTGAEKRQALQQWQAGASLPVAQITARNSLTVLMDEAACG